MFSKTFLSSFGPYFVTCLKQRYVIISLINLKIRIFWYLLQYSIDAPFKWTYMGKAVTLLDETMVCQSLKHKKNPPL